MASTTTSRILYLITGHNASRLTYGEQAELQAWIGESEANQALFQQLGDHNLIKAQVRTWSIAESEDALLNVKAKIQRRGRQRRMRLLAAIITTALVGLGVYIVFLRQQTYQQFQGEAMMKVASTVNPGTDRATLTLANGSVINLDHAQNGAITAEGNIKISKTADGQLSYEVLPLDPTDKAVEASELNTYNTITTPKGGQYQVRLPDGSKVWLNAASTLRYAPFMTVSKPRIVELSGEAYFEVATKLKDQSGKLKAEKLPFIVKTATQQIEVLGTHFNVNSYVDEAATATTLLEGAVKVSRPNESTDQSSVILSPGQQAINNKQGLQVTAADAELAVAWKNGQIRFKDAPLHEILKQAARWYNIEIAYQGIPPAEKLSGGISRSDQLDVLLRILELKGIAFEMQRTGTGYKLVVLDR